MTDGQAQAIVREIDASWNFPFSRDQFKTAAWVKAVVVFEQADARRALESCIGAYSDRPSPAEFVQACRAVERQREDHAKARALHESRLRGLAGGGYDAEVEAQRARDHIAGRGRPNERQATVAYNREWMIHLREPMARIGRMCDPEETLT